MLEFLRKNKPTQLNNDAPGQAKLKQMRKRIGMQALLAVMTVLVAVVIIFGMTAAWYTNVVQSSGLIFQVEQMGIDVDATVYANSFTAQPGDEGTISLEATNNGADAVRITVTVSKVGMLPEMQQRLFFYVEDQTVSNEELVQRNYLTTAEGYDYYLFGGNSLTLTEAYHNDSPVKWCWVYDVLGYYVLGQGENDTVSVDEYLRPIEYDYDLATFDADGNLLTVDGTTSVDSFLTNLSRSDGYAGTISADNMTGSYYRVDVNENGYGVYAYLCTYQEVENNTDYDSMLGSNALQGNPATYTARFTVKAENVQLETVTVSDGSELAQLLAAGETEAIRLTGDVTLDADTVITVPTGSDVLLDLNGHTLTTTGGSYAVTLEENAAMTMTGGALVGAGTTDAFYLAGGELTLHDVDISGYRRGFYVQDYVATGQDSSIYLSECNMEVSSHMLTLLANGSMSENPLRVTIEDCELISNYGYVIGGNGSVQGTGRWGTDIQVINSRLVQDVSDGAVFAAIYHPQPDSTLNIYGSYVSGYTGIAMKGGTLIVEQSTVYGVGTPLGEPAITGSGFSDTGDAIYVETGYNYDIHVTIRDSSATSYYNMGMRVFEGNSPYVTLIQEGTNTIVNNSKSAVEGTEAE